MLAVHRLEKIIKDVIRAERRDCYFDRREKNVEIFRDSMELMKRNP